MHLNANLWFFMALYSLITIGFSYAVAYYPLLTNKGTSTIETSHNFSLKKYFNKQKSFYSVSHRMNQRKSSFRLANGLFKLLFIASYF